MEIDPPQYCSVQRSSSWRNLTRCLALLSLCISAGQAQTVWRAELPTGLPEREANVVRQLSQRLSSQTGAVQMATPQVGTRNQREVLARVLSDDSQIALIPIASLTGAVDFQVFDSIFLFKNLEAVDIYTNSIEGQRLLDELRKHGLQGLGYVHGGMVQLASHRPLNASRDLQGLKVGTQITIGGAPKQLAALGAAPVPLSLADSSFALNAGAVDAIEVGWPALAKVVHDNTDWSVLESNHRYRGYVLVANNAAFKKLSKPAQAKILADTQSV